MQKVTFRAILNGRTRNYPMATLREYFEADFNYATRVHVRVPAFRSDVEIALLYDFAAFTAFLACYVPGNQHPLQVFLQLIEALQPGKSQVTFDEKVTLPSARMFPGQMEIKNTDPFELRAKFHGDPDWISTNGIPASTRIFIY